MHDYNQWDFAIELEHNKERQNTQVLNTEPLDTDGKHTDNRTGAETRLNKNQNKNMCQSKQ